MAMNKFMHPRNTYKSPPNFQQLAIEYPEFRKFVKMDISGKVIFDFKDLDSLRALSKTLLKKDFNLDVEIPNTKLVPTIPLRLNYILWIEDVLNYIGRTENVQGVDIGTGASCVYPLMAAKSKKWHMIATDIDAESIEFAKKNIERNQLDTYISLIKVSGDTLLKDIVDKDTEFDFCMCNPPFFSSPQELHPFFKSRKQNRPHPKNAFVANVNEVVSKGGEVEFIKKIIKESYELQTKIKIYTTMVGQKNSLPPLKLFLREMKVHSFKETEFCQGNTTRWGLAWTYCKIDLLKMPDLVKLAYKTEKKASKPLRYIVPIDDASPVIVNKVTLTVLNMFRDLEMTCEEVTRNKMNQRFFVTAHANTWSNQRRKRREKQRKMSQSDEIKEEKEKNNNEKSKEINDSVELEVKSPGKRTLDDLCDGVFQKKLRLEENETSLAGGSVFFKFVFSVICEENTIVLEINTIEENGNKEYLCQILQYVKNNFKSEEIFKTE